MKKIFAIIISLLFILIIAACNKDTKNSNIENQKISIEEACYLIKSQYNDEELKNGYKYDYEFLKEKEKNGIAYYEFSMNIINEKNEITGKLPNVLVAVDGSHVVDNNNTKTVSDNEVENENNVSSYMDSEIEDESN